MSNEQQKEIDQLKKDIEALSSEFYRNNFTGHQDFNKSVSFNSRLKVPHYASAPVTAEVGELIEVGGKLYICSSTNVWTLVGGQV